MPMRPYGRPDDLLRLLAALMAWRAQEPAGDYYHVGDLLIIWVPSIGRIVLCAPSAAITRADRAASHDQNGHISVGHLSPDVGEGGTA